METFVKNDKGKPRYSLIPPVALHYTAEVLTFGAQKYASNNWRNCDDLSRYMDAGMRHIEAYRRGEVLDPETNLPHLAHAVCCLMFIMELD